jgi:opacity protein-like surface antigen
VKGFKYLLVLATFLVNHAAFADLPIYATPAASKQAHGFKPPKGKAIVYIYQRLEDGRDVSPKIWINNYEIGRLVPGTFTVWKMSPGRLNIRVGETDSANLAMTMQAGQIYRFRLSVSETNAGTQIRIRSIPARLHSELASTRLLKNPRQVTSLVTRTPVVPKQPVSPPVREQAPQPKKTPSVQVSEQEYDSSLSVDGSITPGGFGLMFKTGTLTLSEDTQTILGTDRRFDDSASSLFAAELYYQFDSGVTVGAELLSYTADFTTVGMTDTHNVDVTIIFANARRYFRNYSSFQPYIGAGAGLAVTDISGPTLGGNTAGVAYQLLTGVEYRGADVGVFGEIKYVGAETEDDNGETIDVSGTGIFAGVAFHF